MKIPFILIFLFFILINTYAQDLNNIQSINQIDSLINSNSNRIGRFTITPNTTKQTHIKRNKYGIRIFDSLHIQTINHINFISKQSNNVLINGIYYWNPAAIFCYIDQNKNQIFDLIGTHNTLKNTMTFAKPANRNKIIGINVFNVTYNILSKNEDSIITQKIDTQFLIYKFNGLVEYNHNPNKQKFDTIQLTYSGIYNDRSYFIRIYKNRRMDFQNFDMKAEDTIRNQKLNAKEYRTIVSILNYTNYFKDTILDAGFVDSYWMQTNLSFTNGNKVSIYDRGLEKSFVMRRLYEAINRIMTKYFPSKLTR